MKKRILSIVLAVLMLLSVLPTTALAAEESVAPQNVVTAEQGGVKVEKRAEWTDEKNGKAKITFTLTGGTMTSLDIPKTDIVLVIDKSASMSKNGSPKMNNAKKAAVSFVDKFFGTGADQGYKDKVQIAVVSYSDSATTNVGLTNQKERLTSAINGISAKGGTHIQAGIHLAQQILDADKREKVKKLIVVLSDGEPTYSYPFTATGTFTGCTKTNWWEDCNARLTSYGAFTAVYSKTIGDGTSFSGMETDNGIFNWNWENSGNASVSGTCNKNHDRTQYGAYAVNGTFTARGSSNHGVGTIWEAKQAKAKGTEIFAVGFDIGSSGNAYNTMTGVATDAEHYKAATTTDISFIFNTIADTITQAIAKDAKLTDPLGTGFTLTTSEGGTTYTENVGDLSEKPTKIEFEIQYDTAHPAAGETLPTNNGATLTYTDANGTQQTIRIGNPELENLARTVTYVDENGNAYTDEAHKEKPHWYGDTVTLAPAPTKEGYTFNGWTPTGVTIAEGENSFEMPKNNVTLKASWIKNTKTLTITKNWEGTTEKPTVTFLLTQKKNDVPTNYTRTFMLDGEVDTGSEVVETAPWTATIEVPVKDTDGTAFEYSVRETEIGDISVTIPGGDVYVTAPNPDGSAYNVVKWHIDFLADYQENTYSFTNTYTALEHDYEVEYKFVGTEKPDNVTVPSKVEGLYKGQRIALARVSTSQAGWTFNGWYSTADCGEGDKVGDPGSTYEVKGSAILYGEWTYQAPQPETATLSFEFKSGTEDKDLPAGMPTEPKDVTEEVGKEVQLTNYTTTVDDNNGKWTFVGWYTDAGCTEAVADPYVMPNTDTKLYGKWTFTENTPETATLRFEFKSGTDGKNLPASGMPPAPSNVTEEVGTAVQLTNYTATVDDNNGKWSFDGWYEDEDLNDKINDTTYPMPVNGGTLYGKWTFTENTPEPQPGLSVEKKAYLVGEGDETTEITSATKVRPGDTIQYVITIRNTGDTVLNNLTVRDVFTAAAADDLVIEGGVLPENATLAKGGEIEIKATYVVQDNDVTVKNKVTVTTADVNGEDEVITDIDRGDVDGYGVSGWIKKIVESKKGTFKKDASFTFDIWADEDCTDRLKTIAISKEWAVTKDDYDVKAGMFSFEISENDFAKLDTKDDCKVIHVTERKGDIKGMTYDSDVVTMYLRRSPVVVNSLNIVGSYEATTNPMLDVAAPAEFTNVYKKPADKGETIKSGPQLNRDDHVAYIMGYPDGTVQPEGEITRAEACTIFFRLLTDSSRDYYFARTNDYSDVNRGDWFNNAISTLSNAGIVTGYNDGTFRPNQPITRGEMAKIIANFANLKSGGKTFTDLAGHWSKSYVELAAGNGWIAGYPDGSFRPDQKITRAETVTMINRVLDRVPAKESRLLSRSIMLTFPDNKPGDWYYIAIQEASNSHEYQRSVYETTGDEMWTKLIDNVDWTKLEK